MKKILSIVTISMLLLSLAGCSSTAKTEVETNVLESVKYFNDAHSELTKIASEKDEAKMIAKLEEVIPYLDERTDYFLEEMNNDENEQNVKDACMNVKTAFYGASTEAYKPMLAVFKKESNEVPDNYDQVIEQCKNYLNKAENLIK